MSLFNKISRVAIVDDHLIFMEGFKLLLSRYKFLNIVGQYIAAEYLLRALPTVKPEIVFLDIYTDGMRGWDAVKEIHKYDPAIKVIAVTQFSQGYVVNKMLESGINGYIVKAESIKELVPLFEKLDRNEIYISSEAEFNSESGDLDLSLKEFDIVKLLAASKDLKNIATELDISEKTLLRYIDKLFKKFGVSTTAGIVAMAYTLKLLP